MYLEGLHVKGVWPMKDRSACGYICEFVNEYHEYCQIQFDSDEDLYPVKGACRMDMELVAWILTPLSENRTKIVHYSNGDPKVSGLPNWVVKKASKDSMHLPLKIIQILEEGKAPEKDQKK